MADSLLEIVNGYAADSMGIYTQAWAESVLARNGYCIPPKYNYSRLVFRSWKEGAKTAKASASGKNKVTVYPNPGKEQITFSLDPYTGIQSGQVQVFDLNGRLRWHSPIGAETQSVIWHPENATAGMYMYRVLINDELAQSGKILIK